MKKYLRILVMIFALIFLASCSDESAKEKDKSDTNSSGQVDSLDVNNSEDKDGDHTDDVANDAGKDIDDTQALTQNVDVDKYLENLFVNKDKRTFYMKLRTVQNLKNDDKGNNFNDVTEIFFDGKVLKNETFQSDDGIETYYIDVDEGQETTYHSVVYPSGELKKKYPPVPNTHNGVIVDGYFEIWEKDWKLDEELSKGDLLVCKDELMDDELNILSPDEHTKMSGTNGKAKTVATFSKQTGDIVKFELYVDYKTQVEVTEEALSLYKSGNMETNFSEVFEKIEFRPVEKLEIPQDLLDAEEVANEG